MGRFAVDYRFRATACRSVEADSLDVAQDMIEREVNSDDFDIEADEIDDVDFAVREMHPVTRAGKEIWTTYVIDTDVRGHASALAESPLFGGQMEAV